jgi:hypothetical protein
VNVAVLDATGRPTGSVLTTTTIDDLGTFGVDVPSSAPLRFEANGGYYNEATGALSTAPLTLRAYYLPDGSGSGTAYVNAITHLTARRVERLVAEGSSFAGAVEQAEFELRAALRIVPASLTLTRRATETTVAGADDLDNAYLFAVSTVFAVAAQERTPASPDVGLQELINTAAIDLVRQRIGLSAKSGDASNKVGGAHGARPQDTRNPQHGSPCNPQHGNPRQGPQGSSRPADASRPTLASKFSNNPFASLTPKK